MEWIVAHASHSRVDGTVSIVGFGVRWVFFTVSPSHTHLPLEKA